METHEKIREVNAQQEAKKKQINLNLRYHVPRNDEMIKTRLMEYSKSESK